MKKKALLLASMGILACTVGVTALACGGANQLDAFPVKADPIGYEITFNAESTVEQVGNHYAIYTTTPRGAKVGVVGYNSDDADMGSFTFNGTSFWHLCLFDNDGVLTGRAYDFDLITGFAISFEEGGLVAYESAKTSLGGELITSGTPRTGLSLTPSDTPQFYAGNSVTVSSLTIWYSC